MTDPRTGIDLDSPFAFEPITVWSGWATAFEASILFVFIFVLPALAGAGR